MMNYSCNLVKFIRNSRVSKYYSSYDIMIFPYKDYAESFEIKNMSSMTVCKSIIASYLLV